MIPREMKYNLLYGKVRGDVLPPAHGTNTSCSVAKYTSKRLPLAIKNTLRIRKWESRPHRDHLRSDKGEPLYSRPNGGQTHNVSMCMFCFHVIGLCWIKHIIHA